MNLLGWIKENRPGSISEYDDRFEIEHQSGERSTLFKSSGVRVSTMNSHKSLGDIYTAFDGADLFSSTFKIASTKLPKFIGDIELIENLTKLESWLHKLNPCFPEQAVPFMYQAGIGVYAIGVESGKIYEWDQEQGAVSDEFESVDQVLTEWLEAIG